MKVKIIFENHMGRYVRECDGTTIPNIHKLASDTNFHEEMTPYGHKHLFNGIDRDRVKDGDEMEEGECNWCGGTIRHGDIIVLRDDCTIQHYKCPDDLDKKAKADRIQAIERLFGGWTEDKLRKGEIQISDTYNI